VGRFVTRTLPRFSAGNIRISYLDVGAFLSVARAEYQSEYSVSGAGLHTIIRATPSRSFKNDAAGRELCAWGRYFTFTGKVYGAAQSINARQDEAEAFIAEYAPGKKSSDSPRSQSSAGVQSCRR
jgi:primase-polymerase (primpol)-like protein